MKRMSWKRIVLRIVVLAGVVVVFSGCPEIFTGGLNSPLDPNAADYQGFDTVAHPDDMVPHIEDGATVMWLRFVVSAVEGAESYHLQIATAQDFSSGSVIHDKADYPSNVINPESSASLTGDTMYYWRSRGAADSRGDIEQWGLYFSIGAIVGGVSTLTGAGVLGLGPRRSALIEERNELDRRINRLSAEFARQAAQNALYGRGWQ